MKKVMKAMVTTATIAVRTPLVIETTVPAPPASFAVPPPCRASRTLSTTW